MTNDAKTGGEDKFMDLMDSGIREVLDILGAEVLTINRANGWNVTKPEQFDAFDAGPEYRLPAALAAIHEGLSNALEAYRAENADAYDDSLAAAAAAVNMLRASHRVKPFAAATEVQFHPNDKIPAVIALIHSEASEALEAFVNGDAENFIEEMADIVIRVLDCTAGLGMNLGGAILAKLEKNRGRGFRHGGKVV